MNVLQINFFFFLMPLRLLLSTVVFWGLDDISFRYELEKQVFGDAKAGNPSRSTSHESPAQGIAGTGVSTADPAPGDGCEAGLSLLAAMPPPLAAARLMKGHGDASVCPHRQPRRARLASSLLVML